MTAQGSVIGAYCQAPTGRTTGEARSGNRTRLANMLGGLVHSLVRFPGEPAAHQAQHLALGTPVCVAVGIIGVNGAEIMGHWGGVIVYYWRDD